MCMQGLAVVLAWSTRVHDAAPDTRQIGNAKLDESLEFASAAKANDRWSS